MTHRGPFQPLLFCVILCDSVRTIANTPFPWKTSSEVSLSQAASA